VKRSRISRKASKRLFKKGIRKIEPKNLKALPQRGGIHL